MSWKNIILSLLSLFYLIEVEACTGIFQKAENGDYVYARTMEFGADLISFDLLFVPRGNVYAPQKPASGWVSKYAYVGFNPFGLPVVADGLNEKGVACGAFYFPGWAEFEKTDAKNTSSVITNLEFVSWVLGNFTSVSEAVTALNRTKVVGEVLKNWAIIPPLHYYIVDQKGNQAVIEYVGGQLKVYDKPLGTITNSPDYNWHTINARNYIGLRALNSPSIEIFGQEFSQFGQGSGAIGLPGDFTPPSRFIRALFLNQVVLPGKNAAEQITRAFKILNQFDIPKGAIKEVEKNKTFYDETQWTSAADLTNGVYYFHTATDRCVQSINLKDLNLEAKKSSSITIDKPGAIEDITSKFEK